MRSINKIANPINRLRLLRFILRFMVVACSLVKLHVVGMGWAKEGKGRQGKEKRKQGLAVGKVVSVVSFVT